MEYKFEVEEKSAELNHILEENRELKEKLIDREQQLLRLSNANQDCVRQINEKNNLINNISYERDDAVARRVGIETSTFWCATKPIRNALDVVRGINSPKRIDNKRDDKIILSFGDLISYIEDRKDNDDGNQQHIYGKNILLNYDKSKQLKILLVSHKLNYTGAPIALLYYATMLKEQGYCPVIVVSEKDKLLEECESKEIPVLIDSAVNRDIKKYADIFDAVIANTIVTAPVINQLAESNIPVLWWIHEADCSYKERVLLQIMPQHLPDNVSVYTVGAYAHEMLLKYRPLYKAKELLYYIPRIEGMVIKNKNYTKEKKVRFAVVGMQEYRKGQDILVDAVMSLDKDEVNKCSFVFVGKEYYTPINKKIKELQEKLSEGITIIEQLNREEINNLYDDIDCLICPSRDDPMPIVVAEAMQHGKAVICSENTGSAQIINEMKCGVTYADNSSAKLADVIRSFVNNKQPVDVYSANAIKAYRKYFTKEVFSSKAKQALMDTIKAAKNRYEKKNAIAHEEKVSVVIPTYNAGQQFEVLMKSLRNQKSIGDLEIVIVDSGSKDKTVEIARNYNAKVIEIRNEDFSHSYARNLGAENASGGVLLLMTQDALPCGDKWIFNITEPIVSGKFAAVTARELCPDNTELFYKIASFVDAEFRGIIDNDRIGFMSETMNALEMRKSASLSDVSCALNAAVFRQFKYRNNYAEDLDLGIRLLQNGYKLLISHDIRVKHGHNRSCGYYIKRILIEQISFENILPQIASNVDDIHGVALRIVSAANAVYSTLRFCEYNIVYNITAEEYINALVDEFDRYISNPVRYTSLNDAVYKDELLNKCVNICRNYCRFDYYGDYAILHTLKYYLLHDVRKYLGLNGMLQLDDETVRGEINDCILKQMSAMIGIELSKLRYSIILEEKFSEFLGGV